MDMRALCFVDDDADEVRRFRGQLGGTFLIGAGTSLPEAIERLKRQGRGEPDLFVLDMYFPEGPPNTAEGTLEDAIDGLDAGAASIIKKPDPTREEPGHRARVGPRWHSRRGAGIAGPVLDGPM
jgi:CheY-like chemotaxis protein